MTQLHKYETAHTPDHPCGVILIIAKTPKDQGPGPEYLDTESAWALSCTANKPF